MTIAWPLRPLGELAEFRNGINYTKSSFGTGMKVIGVKDFQDHTTPRYLDLEEIDPSGIVTERDHLRDGDILFVRSNGNRELIGRNLYIHEPEETITHSAFTIRVRLQPGLFPRFYAYLLRTPIVRATLTAHGGGTNISNLNQGILARLLVPVPPLETQRRLAKMCAAYDELIDNNRRRSWLLEALARAIHREWFTAGENLRSASGAEPLLDGWGRVPLRDCIEINPKVAKVAVPREGEKPFVAMGSLSNDSMIVGGFELRIGNSGSKFQNGDTLFARITPSLENGKTGFVQFLPDARSVAFGSTEFIVLRSKTLTPELVYLLSRTDEFRGTAIKSMAGASGRQRVQERCFDSMTVVQPSAEILARFTEVVRPMFRLVQELHLQNLNLRVTRDLLLPRLLSGQLSLAKSEGDPAILGEASAALV